MKLNHALVLTAALLITPLLRAGDLPAPLPEFMDQGQMAKWTAAQEAAAPTTATAPEPSTQFYTGKPYVADAGGYVYKYRTYNPEMSRWTTADPSGFPDGVNNVIYAPNPTSEGDDTGLAIYTTAPQNVSSQIASYLTPLATTALNTIPTWAAAAANALLTADSETYASWKISNFTLTGSASGTASSTTAWGLVNVPLTGSYTIPSGLQPNHMSGTIGTPTTKGNLITVNSNDAFTSNGSINVTFDPSLKVAGPVEGGVQIYVNISSATMTYALKVSATVAFTLE